MATTQTVQLIPNLKYNYYKDFNGAITESSEQADDIEAVYTKEHTYEPRYAYSVQAYISSFRLLPEGQYTGYSCTLNINKTGYAAYIVILRAPAESYSYSQLTDGTLPSIEVDSASLTVTIPAEYVSDALTYGLALRLRTVVLDGSTRITGTAAVSYKSNVAPKISLIDPVSDMIVGDSQNTFVWAPEISSDAVQTSWALHIIVGATDTTVASGTGSTTRYTVPANTLPGGAVQWYIQASFREDGETASAVSGKATVVVRYNPSTSNVSTNGKPRLTVSWTASSQQAAQVRVGDTTYPVTWTSDGSYALPVVLSDGAYAVSVRTQTTDGEWSEWTEDIYVDVRNEAPSGASAPVLTYESSGTVVRFLWTAVSSAEAYVLYRNGIPIYAGGDTIYTDISACGSAEYYVRAVYAAGSYIQSGVLELFVAPQRDTLFYIDGDMPVTLTIRHHPRLPERQWDAAADTEFRDYAGRELPVAVSAGHRTRGLTLTAAYRTPGEAAKLISLLGRTVIYKSKKGDSCRGVIVSATRNSGLADAVTYRITAVDDDERAYLT